MCPSYRATLDERDVTRGRANSLRLALSGQMGPDALISDEMAQTMKLCVSCKACRRECPVGVDMARMKIEVTALRTAAEGLSLHERLIAFLPDYAILRRALRRLPICCNQCGGMCRSSLLWWRGSPVLQPAVPCRNGTLGLLVWAMSLTRRLAVGGQSSCLPTHSIVTLSRKNLRAACRVLTAAGYDVFAPVPQNQRPLCCGRTYLSAGVVDRARTEAQRLVAELHPFVAAGIPIVGLEPSCTLALRDEVPALLNSSEADAVAAAVRTFEELLAEDRPDLADCRVWTDGHAAWALPPKGL